jgi:hypothetical protein
MVESVFSVANNPSLRQIIAGWRQRLQVATATGIIIFIASTFKIRNISNIDDNLY